MTPIENKDPLESLRALAAELEQDLDEFRKSVEGIRDIPTKAEADRNVKELIVLLDEIEARIQNLSEKHNPKAAD